MSVETKMEPDQSQPILPRISMRWYFVVVALLGLFITLISRSTFQRNLEIVAVLIASSAVVFLALSALCFNIAYILGAINKLVFKPQAKVQSPFARDGLPSQIIPPRSPD